MRFQTSGIKKNTDIYLEPERLELLRTIVAEKTISKFGSIPVTLSMLFKEDTEDDGGFDVRICEPKFDTMSSISR